MKKAGKMIYLILIILFLYLPILALMVFSFNEGKSMSLWTGFSLKWYKEMMGNTMIMEAIWNTFTIALAAAAIASVIGTAACIGIMAMKKRTETAVMGLNNIPLLNADIVTGISLMMTFLVFGISLSWGTVLLSHITFCIPYVILSVLPKFKQTSGNTYEAALDLGASPWYAFYKVVLPDIRPGIVSGFLLAFTMSVDDFVITHFTRGAGINTISTLIYSQVKVGIRPTLFALSTLIFVTVLVLLAASNFASAKKEGRYKKPVTILLTVLVAALLGGTLLLSGFSGEKSGKEVHIYAFGDYIDPALIEEFEEETGISVIMDTFDTNEEMYPVIKNQSVKYDVICASDYMIDKMIGENLLWEIDYSGIPNISNLSEKYLAAAAKFDPGNKYSVPHTWGTLGILYDTTKIPEGSVTSWNDLWKKEYSGRIVMPDSMRDTMAIALKAKGYSLNTKDETQIAEAADYLTEQKPLVYKYANDSARDMILGGSADLAVIWNGEVLYCQEERPELSYVVPKEGSEEFTDCWAIPKAASNKENAQAWINFMLRKETAKRNYEYLTYSIPNISVIDSVKNDSAKMQVLFPEDSVLVQCESLKNLGAEADDLYTKYWKKFKS